MIAEAQIVMNNFTHGNSMWQLKGKGNYSHKCSFTYDFNGRDDKTLNLHVDRNSRRVSITYGQF
jgi:hypothetical protein